MTIQSERSFSSAKFNNTRNNRKPSFEVNFSENSLAFYEVTSMISQAHNLIVN